MNIKDVRYANTRQIVGEVGGIEALADLMGKAKAQVSSFAGKMKSTGGPRKGIGDEIAMQIEEAAGKPKGWLDFPHDPVTDMQTVIIYETREFTQGQFKEVLAQIDLIKNRDSGSL